MHELEKSAAQAVRHAPTGVVLWAGMPVAQAAILNAATLPPVFEQYPYGTAVFVGLVVFVGVCCVAFARAKYRRT